MPPWTSDVSCVETAHALQKRLGCLEPRGGWLAGPCGCLAAPCGPGGGGFPNVHILSDHQRVNISWGGFNIVQATLNGIQHILEAGLSFDWLINFSGYTYPLVSNANIRGYLAELPRDANVMEARPSEPTAQAWHNFVECDNRMRRIWQLAKPRGITMYVGSQWFVITRTFAEYVTHDEHFVPQCKSYLVRVS